MSVRYPEGGHPRYHDHNASPLVAIAQAKQHAGSRQMSATVYARMMFDILDFGRKGVPRRRLIEYTGIQPSYVKPICQDLGRVGLVNLQHQAFNTRTELEHITATPELSTVAPEYNGYYGAILHREIGSVPLDALTSRGIEAFAMMRGFTYHHMPESHWRTDNILMSVSKKLRMHPESVHYQALAGQAQAHRVQDSVELAINTATRKIMLGLPPLAPET